ncbi:bacterial alpha-L-rhamnosidase [Corynespora cassiicola Philippines]|uniref:alpha-L-rhamnosidase n=1 Tax=Corynespora cassiicola Philippines TaxID=1448308 RepID=A0A2T2N376_CORCC|nr:bacterial alpha-L-rhamnosidase [Corynespora cassiicola Philippines]
MGPIKQAELYDGERYDAREEVAGWSSPKAASDAQSWVGVEVLDALPPETRLVAGYGEPVRRIETVRAIEKITTPSGKTILDFGQNLVGYLRLKDLKAPRGHTVTLRHAEVLENGELGLRPLRICEARDEYTAKGDDSGESWEPRFTFHGFRYAQIDNWPESGNLMDSIEAVVCHTDMQKIGHFHCSNDMVNKLYRNVCWSMRGNFLSIPTDCPQRDERLGWTGDLALFAPTAAFLYQCSGILKNWLVDFEIAQQRLGGLPATVVPDILSDHKLWGLTLPLAIWHDVAVLGPWAVYSATGDVQVLRTQYKSMQQWVNKMDRHVESLTPNLWHPKHFQLGDWLDPAAPPESPWKSATDSKLAADAFLIQTLRLMASIARLVGQPDDASAYEDDFSAARRQFQDEYVSPNGRLSSDSQTAYALAITFDLLSPSQRAGAGARLARIVRTNAFKIGTGFAGTPYVCEALAQTGHGQVAYAMLLNAACPSWLYPISMGATTTWERWDSMLPDGTVNPGEMTSFNHYAFGAVVTFLHERVAGLRREGAGWESIRVEPLVGGGFTSAEAEHFTPYGKAAVSWKVEGDGEFRIEVEVPQGTSAEIVIPDGKGEKREKVGAGKWVFETRYEKKDDWPVKPINPLPAGL